VSRLKLFALAMAVVAVAGVAAAPVAAANQVLDYRLRGDAQETRRGIRLRSDNVPPKAGRVEFLVPNGLRFFEIETLRTTYDLQNDDTLGGGSPRFQIGLKNGKNIHVNIGSHPNFDDATDGNTGNLIELTDERYDPTQLGGDFYSTYEEAVAAAGNTTVTSIRLVVDGGWRPSDGEQTIFV
jgi:hypothetical protein